MDMLLAVGGITLAANPAGLTTMSGLMLVALAVTHLPSVREAIVAKRSFAGQVFALGASAESFACSAWTGAAPARPTRSSSRWWSSSTR